MIGFDGKDIAIETMEYTQEKHLGPRINMNGFDVKDSTWGFPEEILTTHVADYERYINTNMGCYTVCNNCEEFSLDVE